MTDIYYDEQDDLYDDDDLIVVEVDGVVEDQGTLVIFSGRDSAGRVVRFAVDHRAAQGLAEALCGDEGVEVALERWQLI